MAAFAVLACHFRGAFFVEYSLLPCEQQTPLVFSFYAITRLGHEAVLVFFVLSGFLVGGKALTRIHNNTFSPRSYVIDRAVRIMLPLISSLVLALVVNIVIGNGLYIDRLIGNLLSLQGILCAPYFETLWSLSYEVWFYILICCVGYCIMKRNRTKVYLGLSFFTVCLLVFIKLSAYYLFVWFVGAIGYMLLKNKSKILMYVSGLATLTLIGILQFTSVSHVGLIIGRPVPIGRTYIEVFFGIVFVICIVQIIQFPPKHRTTEVLNRIGTKFAAFSYTLYLTHIPVRDFLTYVGVPKCTSISFASISLYLCWLSVAMIVAYGMYYLFERNTNIVKQRIKRKF